MKNKNLKFTINYDIIIYDLIIKKYAKKIIIGKQKQCQLSEKLLATKLLFQKPFQNLNLLATKLLCSKSVPTFFGIQIASRNFLPMGIFFPL